MELLLTVGKQSKRRHIINHNFLLIPRRCEVIGGEEVIIRVQSSRLLVRQSRTWQDVVTCVAAYQCDQICRFIGLWATFKSFWQQLICSPSLLLRYEGSTNTCWRQRFALAHTRLASVPVWPDLSTLSDFWAKCQKHLAILCRSI